MEKITLDTYSQQPDVDKSDFITFEVPKDWLENILNEHLHCSLEEFLDDYTWDHSEFIKDQAERVGVLSYS